jgi:hypothetical protein
LTSSTASPSFTPAPTSEGGSNSGLSTGAKAGIGVGAAVGALALLGVCAFFFYKKGKAAGAKGSDPVNAVELAADPKPTPELGGNSVVEMDSRPNVAEMGPGYGYYSAYPTHAAELSSEPSRGHQGVSLAEKE